MSKFSNPLDDYRNVRQTTLDLIEPLRAEDFSVQPIADVSPPKWHLGHTTWFFEQFILSKFIDGYKPYHDLYNFIFNSYYNYAGDKVEKDRRGSLSRPDVEEILAYRKHVDSFMLELLETPSLDSSEILTLATLGQNHEQQHQELLLYDIKYILGNNPLLVAYGIATNEVPTDDARLMPDIYAVINQGIYEIGHKGNAFHYDNEKEPHKVFLHPYRIRERLVTNGEYLEFVEKGGYANHELWLAEGFDWINKNAISKPLYWHRIDGKWYEYNLSGLAELDLDAPVSHVSYYEANAFASWKGLRLPTEQEWEVYAKKFNATTESANLLGNKHFKAIASVGRNNQLVGDLWEWTESAYLPYPYYKRDEGYLGEYNAKFMINQMVLRGGSWATPKSHIRLTYRNFFQPDKRWLNCGFRLASNV